MDDADDADTATAMAAALGFSSFGAQKPNKRRKFNPSADAFVASASGPALPLHRHSGDHDNTPFTGSNTIPLGLRKPNMNTDEIDLGDDDEDGEQPPPAVPATQRAATYGDDGHDGDGDAEDPDSRYLDTSRPSAPIVAGPADDLQSKIDAIIGTSTTHAHALPQLSSSWAVDSSYPGRSGYGDHPRNANRDTRSGGKWWEGYYDPGFITNPWDPLEKAYGLEPYGTWMSWEEAKAARP
ncbi:hypothetical protein F5Y14DRAFT_93764 [Nemania sp. NC0429]|nr:hypothetical protein F5Y14DRAFT_93764 [Nemania sp. NC0429]